MIVALVLREMVTTYGRSPGGYLWALLEPIAAIGLLSVVFSLAFHAPSLGSSFPLFFASAYLPFMLFLDVTNKVASALRFSRPLLAYPAVTVLDVIAARFILNVATHILVFVIVMAAILVTAGHAGEIDVPRVIDGLAMAAVLALGVGSVNCYLSTAYPIYERLWSVLTRPLVIVSGLFFLLEDVPAKVRDILWLNPLYHVTGEVRAGMYTSYDALYVTPLYVYLPALALFVLGLALLRKDYRTLVNL